MAKARTYTAWEKEQALLFYDVLKDEAKAARKAKVATNALKIWVRERSREEAPKPKTFSRETIPADTLTWTFDSDDTDEQDNHEEEDAAEDDGILERPYPSEALMLLDPILFEVARGMDQWVREVFLSPAGPLYDEDLWFLRDAKIGYLWTNAPFPAGSGAVMGMAEQVGKLGNRWQTAQYHYHLRQWFGVVPDFLIRLNAPLVGASDNRNFCHVVHHELMHCDIQYDEEGSPRMNDEDEFLWKIRRHDSEEFHKMPEWYGHVLESGGSAGIIAASKRKIIVTDDMLTAACGTGKHNPFFELL